MSDSMRTTTIPMNGANGDRIEAYTAIPDGEGSRGGVVVIHHLPGYDRGSKEIVRRIAELGYDAICPNLHYREAPGAAPDDAAAASRAAGGVPDERLLGDVDAAITWLRALDTANGKVGVIGFCSGGRQAVLVDCNLDVDAAVDCYGAFVTEDASPDAPVKMMPIREQLPALRAPLLGLFGNEDQHPSPEAVDTLDRILTENDKPHEVHRYDGAGHAFFSADRPSYRVEAANDGWEQITDFYAKYLSV